MSDWVLDVPLRTERLELREHRAGDLEDLVLFHGDPQVTRYTSWPVRDREQTSVALDRRLTQTRAAEPGDLLSLAVVERASGTVIGEVLLMRRSDSTAELGYAIRADRWGQGLASEAVRALLDGAVTLGLTEVRAVVVDGNDASVRLLDRLGFTDLGTAGPPAKDGSPTRTFALTLG
ncbi:MAG: hypothetical protein B7X41_12740 [Microbacterium sp. 14-71-5]|nr:MAG: hypothetical protein B7X41_12740 [Microbacterium sp. 14-71-5]